MYPFLMIFNRSTLSLMNKFVVKFYVDEENGQVNGEPVRRRKKDMLKMYYGGINNDGSMVSPALSVFLF